MHGGGGSGGGDGDTLQRNDFDLRTNYFPKHGKLSKVAATTHSSTILHYLQCDAAVHATRVVLFASTTSFEAKKREEKKNMKRTKRNKNHIRVPVH